MKRQPSDFREYDENVFALSTGDLMSGLLFIFLLLLAGVMLQMQEDEAASRDIGKVLAQNHEYERELRETREELQAERVKLLDEQERIKEYQDMLARASRQSREYWQQLEEDRRVAREYDNIKEQLYQSLMRAFGSRLASWHATIDRDTLSIRFQAPDIMFDEGRSELKKGYEDILDEFFPKYIEVLNRYRDDIEEVRIEGHTNSNSPADSSCPAGRNCGYYYNMELSQNRARAVLQYCMNMDRVASEKGWLTKRLTANGLSFSHMICQDGKESGCAEGSEDKQLSRRVEFRVRTNAEKQLEEIATRGWPGR